MSINLTRIYTRTGDGGVTRLGDMSTVAKTDPRLVAYADVDEANSSIGLAIALGAPGPGVREVLTRVQNELFDVGADLCNPVVPDPEFPPLRIDQAAVDRLERDCDRYNRDLPSLRSFILPGGTVGSALLHVSRTIVRRAERAAWTALDAYGETTNPLTAKYLNRLSDLLFILARTENSAHGDVPWVPGDSRRAAPAGPARPGGEPEGPGFSPGPVPG